MGNVTSLNVNGKKLRVDVDSQTPLLYVLRDHLSMTARSERFDVRWSWRDADCWISACGWKRDI